MIEIPESLTIAGQLNDTVYGKRIAEVETEIRNTDLPGMKEIRRSTPKRWKGR